MLIFTGQALKELAQVPTATPMPKLRELFNPTITPKTKNNEKSRISIGQRINAQGLC